MYFFDLDGTILDSNGVWVDIDREFLGRFGISPVPADYSDYVTNHSFPDSAAYTRTRYQLDMTDEEIMETWRDMARDAYSGTLDLKPDVKDFLKKAREAGERCAVLTASLPDMCQLALENHNLTHCFERVFTTQEMKLDKSDPQLYRTVAELCGLTGEECVFFDDSPLNCAAARQAGWRVYGVADELSSGREEEFRAICGPGHYPFSFKSPLP